MASSFSGLSRALGSSFGPIFGATQFTDVSVAAQVVADALTKPADSPAADTWRVVTDGTRRAVWHFDASASAWAMNEMTVVP